MSRASYPNPRFGRRLMGSGHGAGFPGQQDYPRHQRQQFGHGEPPGYGVLPSQQLFQMPVPSYQGPGPLAQVPGPFPPVSSPLIQAAGQHEWFRGHQGQQLFRPRPPGAPRNRNVAATGAVREESPSVGRDASQQAQGQADGTSEQRLEEIYHVLNIENGDLINCSVCKNSVRADFTQACFIFDDQIEDGFVTDKEKRQPLLRKFLVMVNALLNSGGGVIYIHTKPCYLEFWDEQVDDNLMHLVPDGTIFDENYVRRVSGNHVTFRVKPRQGPTSTLEFNSKISRNKGLQDPTHQQMQHLMRRRQRPNQVGNFPPQSFNTRNLRKGMKVEFHEDVSNQAKVVLQDQLSKSNDKLQYCWDKLRMPEYIAAFSKQINGGSIFFGLQECKNDFGPQWTEIEPPQGVHIDAESKVKCWKGKNKIHLASEEHVPKKELKTGEFKCLGISLSVDEKKHFEEQFPSWIENKLLWQTIPEHPQRTAPDVTNLVELCCHRVMDQTNLYLLETKVKYFHGVCFQHQHGPVAYSFNTSENYKHTARVTMEEWLSGQQGPN